MTEQMETLEQQVSRLETYYAHLQYDHEQLKKERDELVANIGRLQEVLSSAHGNLTEAYNNGYVSSTCRKRIDEVLSKTPQQSLAEHDAEVARKVIILLANRCSRFFNDDGEWFMTRDEMLEYAQRVKDGE